MYVFSKVVMFSIFSFFLVGCQSNSNNTSPVVTTEVKQMPRASKASISREDLRNAEKVACADLDGDGVDESIFFDQGVMYWRGNREPLSGGLHVFRRSKLPNQEKESLLFATGYAKGFVDATKTLYRLTDSTVQTVWTHDGERDQTTDIHEINGKIFLSIFAEETMVEGGWLENGQLQAQQKFNMATQQQPLPEDPTSLVVGRLYGDEKRSFGDVRIIRADNTTQFLPAFRGVKDIELFDFNKDGHSDILVSDSWHYQYASMARPRVQLYMGPDYQDIRTVLDVEANTNKDYIINNIEVHRDGTKILAQGSQHVYLATQDMLGWKVEKISKITETGQAVFCYAQEQSYILVSGTPAELFSISP